MSWEIFCMGSRIKMITDSDNIDVLLEKNIQQSAYMQKYIFILVSAKWQKLHDNWCRE